MTETRIEITGNIVVHHPVKKPEPKKTIDQMPARLHEPYLAA
jgi:hypothetical protein